MRLSHLPTEHRSIRFTNDELTQIINRHSEKFLRYINKTNDCWIWTKGKFDGGYGAFCIYKNNKKRRISAHRFSWLMYNGLIPDGLLVLHKCDNPPCVNPDHLFIGTTKDNMKDAKNKNRLKGPTLAAGEKNGHAKLTNKKVLEIRSKYKNNNITQKKLALQYSVGKTAIWNIVNKKRWVHI